MRTSITNLGLRSAHSPSWETEVSPKDKWVTRLTKLKFLQLSKFLSEDTNAI